MLIERNMDLGQLAERMGPDATREDAAMMCDLLLVGVDTWDRTETVPTDVWCDCLDAVVEARSDK